MTAIHPTALVDPKARLHDSVSVGPYTIIGADVEIGEGTQVGPHVVLKGPMKIGRNNRIYPFACLGELSQDKSATPDQPTRVEIGDDNVIRENVTINRGTMKDTGITRIGNDNWLMAGTHVAHDVTIGHHTILANNAGLAGHVVIEDYAILGGFTGVHQFCRIGTYAFTGGGSVVLRDVLPYVMVQGNPAEARAVNMVGLRRHGFSAADLDAIRDAYKLIYVSGKPMAEIKAGLAAMAQASAHVGRMLESLESSKRSIAR